MAENLKRIPEVEDQGSFSYTPQPSPAGTITVNRHQPARPAIRDGMINLSLRDALTAFFSAGLVRVRPCTTSAGQSTRSGPLRCGMTGWGKLGGCVVALVDYVRRGLDLLLDIPV